MVSEPARRVEESRAEESPHPSAWSRHRGPVTGVGVIPGTRTVVTSAYDSAVGLFHLDSGEPELLGYHDHLVNRVVVSPRRPARRLLLVRLLDRDLEPVEPPPGAHPAGA